MKNQPTRRITKVRENRSSVEALAKRLGFQKLETVRRADLTPELVRKARLTPKEESRVVAVAELSAQGMPIQVADALVTSGAVGSVAELAALESDQVKAILNEPAVKRLLPPHFEINVEFIQQWLQRIGPQAVDDEGPARGALGEDQEKSDATDEDAAVAAEDVLLNRSSIDELLRALQEHCRRGEAAVQLLTKSSGDQPEASAVQDTLLNLQTGLATLVERFMAAQSGGLTAINEESSPPFEDEEIDPAKKILELEDEYKDIKLRLDLLCALHETGDEDRSPAAAVEEAKAEADEETKEEAVR